MLAIGASYLCEDVDVPTPFPPDMIYVRRVTDAETKPKQTATTA